MFRTGIHALCHAAIALLAIHCGSASAGWHPDIPMWYHTKKALFIGVYQNSSACKEIVMTDIRIVSAANGSVLDNVRPASCEAGTLMTDIYRNVESGNKPRNVTIHYGGGKMGHEELTPLKPAAY